RLLGVPQRTHRRRRRPAAHRTAGNPRGSGPRSPLPRPGHAVPDGIRECPRRTAPHHLVRHGSGRYLREVRGAVPGGRLQRPAGSTRAAHLRAGPCTAAGSARTPGAELMRLAGSAPGETAAELLEFFGRPGADGTLVLLRAGQALFTLFEDGSVKL